MKGNMKLARSFPACTRRRNIDIEILDPSIETGGGGCCLNSADELASPERLQDTTAAAAKTTASEQARSVQNGLAFILFSLSVMGLG